MKKISFDCDSLNERGTGNAIFDYAYYNEKILGNRSIVFYNSDSPDNNVSAVNRFKKYFDVIPYRSSQEFIGKARTQNIEITYFLCNNKNIGDAHKYFQCATHEIFQIYNPQPHCYAYISEWLSMHMSGGTVPFVPHIVDCPPPTISSEDYRKKLNLSNEQIIIGRLGGYNQFNLKFVKTAIAEILERRKDIVFLLPHTEHFIDHKNVIYLGQLNIHERSNFLCAIDYFLHARKIGESFGLANAEAAFFGIPIITWYGGRDRNHLAMPYDTRIIYYYKSDFIRKILNLQKPIKKNGQAIKNLYSPDIVMQKFNGVFLENDYNFTRAKQKNNILQNLSNKYCSELLKNM